MHMDIVSAHGSSLGEPQGFGFIGDLVKLMRNPEFKDFYDRYFRDWNDIQSMVFFMKLYSSIEYEYRERFAKDIAASEMAGVLEQVMADSQTRGLAMELFQEFKSSMDYKKTKSFRSLLQFAHADPGSGDDARLSELSSHRANVGLIHHVVEAAETD